MINYIKIFLNHIVSLHRYSKRLIAIITDASLCFLSTWIAFIIRSEYWLALNPEIEVLILYENFNFNSVLLSAIIAIPVFWLFGLYRTIFRYTGFSILFTILMSSCIYGILYFSIGVYIIEGIPRPIGFFQPLLLFFTILSSRLGIKYIFSRNYDFKKLFNKKKILIYGAGDAGRQLLTALENSSEFKVIGFLDDNSQLQRQILLGQTIYSPSSLERLIKTKNVSTIFLALPTIDRVKRNQIIKQLNHKTQWIKTKS